MANDRTPQTADKYIVRFPDGMRDRIAEAAKANNRTMNAEIVARLQESFGGGGQQETLYVLLDSDGYPQSWDEIHEYLVAIRKAADIHPSRLDVLIVTPDMVGSSTRATEAAKLARRLRAQSQAATQEPESAGKKQTKKG